jgi:hypothetical protein
MILNEIIWHFKLDNDKDPRILVIPFLQHILPYIVLTARSEAAVYYEYNDPSILSQEMIIKFLMKYRDYDAIEVSKIVENWRKEYGTHE